MHGLAGEGVLRHRLVPRKGSAMSLLVSKTNLPTLMSPNLLSSNVKGVFNLV